MKRQNNETPARKTKKSRRKLSSSPEEPRDNHLEQQMEQIQKQQEEMQRKALQQQEENQRLMEQMRMMQQQILFAMQQPQTQPLVQPQTQPSVPSAETINTQPPVNYSNLDDLLSQPETDHVILEPVDPPIVPDLPSTSQNCHQHQSTSQNGHQHESESPNRHQLYDSSSSSESDHDQPGPSGLCSQRSKSNVNYYESPSPNANPRVSPFSPTSPSLLEFHKKNAKTHKKNLSEAQKMNITVHVMLNWVFGAGRKCGYRKAKGKKNKKQPFKTKSKSQFIKEYYENYFPELFREWGDDFDDICPIKPADIHTWLRNISLYGSTEKKDNKNLPEPPNPSKDA